MNHLIPQATRCGGRDTHEVRAEFAGPFDLYGRHHEVTKAEADVGVTRLSEGLHLDVRVGDGAYDLRQDARAHGARTGVRRLGVPSGPNNPEVCVQDWTLDLARYTEGALPNEVPMQVPLAPSPCTPKAMATR